MLLTLSFAFLILNYAESLNVRYLSSDTIELSPLPFNVGRNVFHTKDSTSSNEYVNAYFNDPDAGRDTTQLIESRGFGFERHWITTEDGYILIAYRIVNPFNKNSRPYPILIPNTIYLFMDGWLWNYGGSAIPPRSPANVHNAFPYIMMGLDMGVETFFLMSALLVARKLLSDQSAKRQPSQVRSYATLVISRYLRLAPLYAFVIWFRATMVDDLLTRPLWLSNGIIDTEASACATDFWRNLLLLNNLSHNTVDRCLMTTWYIAALMQMLVVSSFVILLLARHRQLLTTVVATMCLASIATTFLISYMGNANHVVDNSPLETLFTRWKRHHVKIFLNPICRFPAYGLGILLANCLHDQQKLTKHGKWASFSLLMAASGLIAAALSLPSVFTVSGIYLSIYTSLFRGTWTLGFALIIYVAFNAQTSTSSSYLSKFFHSPLWMPFSRLTFCVYLVHLFIITVYLGSLEVVKNQFSKITVQRQI